MKEVVIIGAGPAGLTAAYELLKEPEKYQVTILEASGEIGGISRTVRHNGNRMDIGGHRFFSKDPQVMDWWRTILPLQGHPSYDDLVLGRESSLHKGGPDPETEDPVMLVRNRVSRIYYNKKFFDYPISMRPQTFINMGFAQTLRAGCSYLHSCIHKKEESSLENFYKNRFGGVLYAMFFEGYTEKLWGRHPREISADWGAQRVKGLSISALIKNLFSKETKETSLIESFWYPKYGPGQLWETVAEEIENMGGRICYHAEVHGIALKENMVSSVSYTDKADGAEKVKEADIFISSMPLKDLVLGMGTGIPKEIQRIAEGLPYRDFVTVGLLVDRLELKNTTAIRTLHHIIPDCWIYVQDTNVRLGRIQIFNNWSPYLVEHPKEKVWIGLEYFCQEGDGFWNMSDEDCAGYAIEELVKMGIIKSKDAVEDWHRERVKKAYPAYFDTYQEIDRLVKWVDGIENLYCIGRNGQHRYNNMDHSMATAFKTAEHISNGNRKAAKDAIWNVNTEQEYHESNEKG